MRILVVADRTDYFSFSAVPDASDNKFTLTEFVSTLRNTSSIPRGALHFDVTLAHRDVDLGVGDPKQPNLMPGTVTQAVFTYRSVTATQPGTVVDLVNFDVVFLFGVHTEDSAKVEQGSGVLRWDGSAGEDQVWAFVQFMEAGGGIFATGDHEDMGVALCGSIPRVRSMRRWWWSDSGPPFPDNGGEGPETPGQPVYGLMYAISAVLPSSNRVPLDEMFDTCAPPSVGPWRIDTLQGPVEKVSDAITKTSVSGISFDRQSDDLPQPVTLVGNPPHPVFAMGGGRFLSHLPDHMHEGRVIDLTDYAENAERPKVQTFDHRGSTIREYPVGPNGVQPLPQIVLTTTSGGHVTPSSETEHTGALDVAFIEPHDAVCAYDGSTVGVGRIVTQSTFHHFFDINLIGDPATDVPNDARRHGFTTTAGQSQLADFHQYWRNLALWLSHRNTGPIILRLAILQAAADASVRMTVRPAMRRDGNAIHDVGALAAQRLDRQIPAPLLADLVHRSIDPTHAAAVTATAGTLRRASATLATHVHQRFSRGFLGGAVLHATLGDSASTDWAGSALPPALVAAGMDGALKSLSVSVHAPALRPLLTHLRAAVS